MNASLISLVHANAYQATRTEVSRGQAPRIRRRRFAR
jgi:hypothetical protein